MQVERIEFVREGGFAGIPLATEIDPQSLSTEESAKLHDLLESADFLNLPPVLAPANQGADRFQYNLTVEADGKRHAVRITGPAPVSLRELIEFLTKLARKNRSQRPGKS